LILEDKGKRDYTLIPTTPGPANGSTSALNAAIRAGIKFEADGGDLLVEAEGPVPDTIISELKRNKTGILSLSGPVPSRAYGASRRLVLTTFPSATWQHGKPCSPNGRRA
jgi:hypothetical protein